MGYIKAEDIPLDIVYEDDYLMIINKPSGMVVHPGNGNEEVIRPDYPDDGGSL